MRRLLAALAVSIVAPAIASASTIPDYRVAVRGTFVGLEFFQLLVTERFGDDFVESPDLAEVQDAFLATYPKFRDVALARTGTATILSNVPNAQSSVVNCSGFLSLLCEEIAEFDPATNQINSSNGMSVASVLDPSKFVYEDDAVYSGLSDNYDFLVSNGVKVIFSIDELTITPVPLPAGGLLFVTGLAGLGAMRRKRAKALDIA